MVIQHWQTVLSTRPVDHVARTSCQVSPIQYAQRFAIQEENYIASNQKPKAVSRLMQLNKVSSANKYIL